VNGRILCRLCALGDPVVKYDIDREAEI